MSELIGSLSPSRLAKLACPARVGFDQAASGKRGNAIGGSAATLGTITHDALEGVIKGSAFDDAWSDACDSAAGKGQEPETIPSLRRVKRRCGRRAAELLVLLESFGPSEAHTEERIVSGDGEIEGTPDLVVELPDRLIVIDYKSGLVTGEGGIKTEYETQLRIYASLAGERFAKPVERAVLFSLVEDPVDVDVSPDAVSLAMSNARAMRDEFNARVPDKQPELPSESTCQWCPHKVRCDGFWQSVEPEWSKAIGGSVVAGQLLAIETSQNGRTGLQLADQSGETGVVLAGVPEQLCQGASAGQLVRATGLWSRADHETILRWSDRSSIWFGGQE